MKSIEVVCPRCKSRLGPPTASEAVTCGVCTHVFDFIPPAPKPPREPLSVDVKGALWAIAIVGGLILMCAAIAKYGESAKGPLILAFLGVLYFTPSFQASKWKCPSRQAIFFVNLVTGWTLIGWIGAWIMAVVDRPKPKS